MKQKHEDITIAANAPVISVKGARSNNLKNIDVEVPRGRFVVITGVSGSGKSSLAFDTLYAEGQRRYVESLSAYARQFLGKLSKPECDYIKGLPPAIAIEQRVNSRNPRSTVGTSTEIYDYLRLLFGRVGRTFSPISGCEVRRHVVDDVVDAAATYPVGTRVAVVAPLQMPEKRRFESQLNVLLKAGYSRLYRDGQFVAIEDLLTSNDRAMLDATSAHGYDLLVDRLATAAEGDEVSRLADSVETAFFEGANRCALIVWDGDSDKPHRHDFSTAFEADGLKFIEPSDQLFNFNNPYGACPRCEGFGRTLGIDERLVIPNPALSVYDDAVACWKGEKMSQWKKQLIHIAPHVGFPIHTPYADLTPAQRDYLWHGDSRFGGIDGFFRMVEENMYKIQYRVLKARYTGKTTCPDCHGGRLRPEALYVKVGGKTIADLTRMPVTALAQWFDNLQLQGTEATIAKRILTEIKSRLSFLVEVGLGYLTLDRLSNSLSGGESQRINLATSLGSALMGSLYILDEPSIGLHPRDTKRLINVLRHLQEIGNTVVVVEHDEEIMRAADYLIDIGPRAGRLGGEVIYQGDVDKMLQSDDAKSLTVQYLNHKLHIPVPRSRRAPAGHIEIKGARQHNLKNLDVRFPLGVMTVVTGVSGSGKSTLVRDILYKAMVRHLDQGGDTPGAFTSLGGDLRKVEAVEFVDQNPIGRSTRSNPATYLKAWDEIRHLMAGTQHARQMGFTPAYFSFNTDGGRCDECKGEGQITIEMQFMADITIPCEACHGQRFKRDILEVKYRDKNVSDILDMTVDEAIEFFGQAPDAQGRRVAQRLQPLQDVGLGYIKLGQTSSTLSGGENQRVKLAYFLGLDRPRPTLFIFDEPTTGLHFHDISTLLDSFDRLIKQGHTVVIIEHNLDVIKCADHVIDIGPEGGDAGGQIVAQGTPEEVAACPDSYTAKYLKPLLK